MILRRLAISIRNQDWFAVVIEFVIVVAGVLFAFQVSETASVRDERAYARDTMVRLESELHEIERVRAVTRPFIERNVERISAARTLIMGDTEGGSLTQGQCAAIARSHVIDRPADAVPTLSEVIQSGVLASIENEALRRAVMLFASKQEATREWIRLKASDMDNLAERFPEMMWYEQVAASDGDDLPEPQIVCDLNAMRASRAFQTYLMGNFVTLRDTKDFVYEFMDVAFSELHTAIDAELGIVHEPEEADE